MPVNSRTVWMALGFGTAVLLAARSSAMDAVGEEMSTRWRGCGNASGTLGHNETIIYDKSVYNMCRDCP